jgi:hypothetical protein
MHLHANGKKRLIFLVGFSLWLIKKGLIFVRHQRWDGIAAMVKGWRSNRACFAPQQKEGCYKQN